MKKILVLGASGMLGHKVFEVLNTYKDFDVYGTVTSKKSFSGFYLVSLNQRIEEFSTL